MMDDRRLMCFLCNLLWVLEPGLEGVLRDSQPGTQAVWYKLWLDTFFCWLQVDQGKENKQGTVENGNTCNGNLEKQDHHGMIILSFMVAIIHQIHGDGVIEFRTNQYQLQPTPLPSARLQTSIHSRYFASMKSEIMSLLQKWSVLCIASLHHGLHFTCIYGMLEVFNSWSPIPAPVCWETVLSAWLSPYIIWTIHYKAGLSAEKSAVKLGANLWVMSG